MEPLRHAEVLASSVVGLLVIGILKSVVGSIFVEEWKAWAPRLAQRIMHIAIKWLPADQRERYLEQWTTDLSDTPGFLGKILFALDLNRASLLIFIRSDRSKTSEAASTNAVAAKLAQAPVVQPPSELRIPISGTHAARLRVLVVDDEPVIASTLAIILQQAGYAAKAAFSGEEAIEIARSYKPQALITDVLMDGINGIETGIAIRSLVPNCRVWLFAGQSATTDLVKRAVSSGHDFDILKKPVHPNEIIKGLRTIDES